jgi:hypothetical protein
VLEGGNAAWCGAGLTPASGPTHLLSPRDDLWLASSERPGDARANVMAYLDWETSLLAAIERGGCVPFRNVLWQRIGKINAFLHRRSGNTLQTV